MCTLVEGDINHPIVVMEGHYLLLKEVDVLPNPEEQFRAARLSHEEAEQPIELPPPMMVKLNARIIARGRGRNGDKVTYLVSDPDYLGRVFFVEASQWTDDPGLVHTRTESQKLVRRIPSSKPEVATAA